MASYLKYVPFFWFKLRQTATKSEMALLSLTDLEYDRPADVLAKLTKSKVSTVRSRLQRLRRLSLLTRTAIINPYAHALIECTLLFSLRASGAKERLRISKEFISLSTSCWVGELGGDYHYGLSFLCHHISELRSTLTSVNTIVGNTVQRRRFAIRTSSHLFCRKYLFDGRQPQALHLRCDQKKKDLDETDQRIIAALLDARYESLRDLSHDLSIPLATLDRRLRRLREAKVFFGWRNGSSSSTLGAQKYTVFVSLKQQSERITDEISVWAQGHSHVSHVIEAVGDWDVELGVEVWRSEDIPEILDAWYGKFADYTGEIQVVPEFRCLKFRPWIT